MAWTEERVATLAKLWAEGWSASQIANELGDVTRNAVIGKVHRLGFAQRDKPAGKGGSAGKRKQTTAAPRKPSEKLGATARKSGGQAQSGTAQAATGRSNAGAGNTADADTQTMEAEAPVESEIIVDVETDASGAPKSRKLILMQLTENTCKWPTGDPTMPGFSFCGHTSEAEKPYCAFHNKLAFQPPSDRRRRR